MVVQDGFSRIQHLGYTYRRHSLYMYHDCHKLYLTLVIPRSSCNYCTFALAFYIVAVMHLTLMLPFLFHDRWRYYLIKPCSLCNQHLRYLFIPYLPCYRRLRCFLKHECHVFNVCVAFYIMLVMLSTFTLLSTS